jgi:Protein of unknown function (DUF429)
MKLYGIDFTSSPSSRKSITIAAGVLIDSSRLRVLEVVRLTSLPEFERWLDSPGPWLAGCDFPFGLPRELLAKLDWPHQDWAAMVDHLASLSRAQMIAQFRDFCAARPVGGKFAHRATDQPAGSSPSMKWVNPPVALMLHAGAPRLLAAGIHLPGLHSTGADRVALEAYPGLLARKIIGRASYKSDDRRKQTADRLARRAQVVDALVNGAHDLNLRCELSPGLAAQARDDASGDDLDAVLCLVQAGWAWLRRDANYGLPALIDPVEGWIVTAASPAQSSL